MVAFRPIVALNWSVPHAVLYAVAVEGMLAEGNDCHNDFSVVEIAVAVPQSAYTLWSQ